MYQPTLGHPNRRDTLRHLPQEAAREVFPRHHRLLAAGKPGRQGATPNEAISNITRKARLRRWTRRYRSCCFASWNRNCEMRTSNFKHQLSDLRDSSSARAGRRYGGPSSAASVVNIHEDPIRTCLPGRGTILLAKNRQGELGHVRFMHNEAVTSFWDDTAGMRPWARPGRRSLNRRERASSNADRRYAAQGAETARIDEVASVIFPLASLGEGLRGAVPVPRRAASLLPRLPGEEHPGSASVAARRRTRIRLVCHMEGCGFEEAAPTGTQHNIEVEETAAAGRERRRTSGKRCCWRTPRSLAATLPPPPQVRRAIQRIAMGWEETYRGFGVGLCPPGAPSVPPPS